MNPLFTLPLHGVFCEPFCGTKKQHYPLNITLAFSHFNRDQTLQPIWTMKDEGERYHSDVTLYKETSQQSPASPEGDNDTIQSDKHRDDSYYLNINCQGNGEFKITKNNITIDWQAQGTGADHYFQTLALALNLELNNVLCIHANALAYQDKAIAIVAPSRTGKTTLTAALSQNGFSLMTDDMIALHKTDMGYDIYPSWPVARMWPDALNELQLEGSDKFQKVHENFEKRVVDLDKTNGFSFCKYPKKLQVIYLLNRLPKNVNREILPCAIEAIPTAKAIILLLQNSILGSCYRALNLEEQRVKALSKLLEKITFKQINYISGKEHLNAVGKLIESDLEAD